MNHGSNRSERYIRTLNDIITKCLVGTGSNWLLYIAIHYSSSNLCYELSGFMCYNSISQMVYNQQPLDKLDFDFDPTKSGMKVDTPLSDSQLIRESRKYPDAHGYAVGDLVLINHSLSSVLKAYPRKLKRDWVGPFKIQSIIDDPHYFIFDWTGQLSHEGFHINRLNPFFLNLGKMKDGKLQTVHNTRELIRIWNNIKEDNVVTKNSMQTQT